MQPVSTLAVAAALSILAAGGAACSDDGAGGTDGAACTCAPAEPPLAGRLVRIEDRRTLTEGLFARADCPVGATLLGGGCYAEGPGEFTPRLIASGSATAGPGIYLCDWDNPQQVEVTVVAWATCLSPAP